MAQDVGTGSKVYKFPGAAADGSTLRVHANNAYEAQQVFDYLRAMAGGPSNNDILNQNIQQGGSFPLNVAPPPPPPPQYQAPAPNYGPPPDYGAQDMSGDQGSIYTPPPPRQLSDSPEWLAYLNSLGFQQQQFESDVQRQRALAQAQADAQIQALGPQYDIQRRNITGALESRGMDRSGEFLRRIAENRAQQGQAQSNIQSGLATNLSGLESQLANKLIDLQAQRSQKELDLRAQGYV